MRNMPAVKCGQFSITQWYLFYDRKDGFYKYAVGYAQSPWETGLTFSYREWWF